MKRWFAATVSAAAGPSTEPAEAQAAADIVLAYIDGETLNLINGRAVPGEDLQGRVVGNALRLFGLLAGGGRRGRRRSSPPDPATVFTT